MTRFEIFLPQLDGLVVFLAAAREEVFDLIHTHELTWFPMSQDPRLPATAPCRHRAAGLLAPTEHAPKRTSVGLPGNSEYRIQRRPSSPYGDERDPICFRWINRGG